MNVAERLLGSRITPDWDDTITSLLQPGRNRLDIVLLRLIFRFPSMFYGRKETQEDTGVLARRWTWPLGPLRSWWRTIYLPLSTEGVISWRTFLGVSLRFTPSNVSHSFIFLHYRIKIHHIVNPFNIWSINLKFHRKNMLTACQGETLNTFSFTVIFCFHWLWYSFLTCFVTV